MKSKAAQVWSAFSVLASVALSPGEAKSAQAVLDGTLAQQSPSSRLRLDNPSRVVMATASGQEVSEVFALSNTGDQPVELEVERTSCGCVGATLSSKAIAPAQRATLTFKMQASGWGSKIESVTLKTNDPNQPHITLTVQVTMPPTVVPNPSQLFVETAEGEATQRFISLLLPEGAGLESVIAHQPFVSTQVVQRELITGGSVYRISVSIAASAPPGPFEDEISFLLKNAPVPQIGVPVEVLVKDDVQVEPAQVFLGQVVAGSTNRKTFLVQSHSGKVFRIHALQSSSPSITVQASSMVTAASHAVEIKIQAGNKVGSILQETIRLTLSSGRILELPVLGMITPASAAAPQAAQLEPGTPAPDFTAMDANGNPWKLTDFRGKKNLLLTFFPKCFTGGCAGQLASLQEHLQELAAAEVQVLAVSVDPPQDQRVFAAQLGLQFPLIPDIQRTLCLLYGAAQDKTDMAARQSILIDKAGIIRWIDTNVNVQTHGTDVLAKMRELGMAK